MFAMFTVTSRPVHTGETIDGEPVYARQQATTAINAAHIVAIEFRPSSTGTDLLIKTMDGDTWSFPGTEDNLAAVKEIIENANCE
jgi:hypothetical protein